LIQFADEFFVLQDSGISSELSSVGSHSIVKLEFRVTFRGICKWYNKLTGRHSSYIMFVCCYMSQSCI